MAGPSAEQDKQNRQHTAESGSCWDRGPAAAGLRRVSSLRSGPRRLTAGHRSLLWTASRCLHHRPGGVLSFSLGSADCPLSSTWRSTTTTCWGSSENACSICSTFAVPSSAMKRATSRRAEVPRPRPGLDPLPEGQPDDGSSRSSRLLKREGAVDRDIEKCLLHLAQQVHNPRSIRCREGSVARDSVNQRSHLVDVGRLLLPD